MISGQCFHRQISLKNWPNYTKLYFFITLLKILKSDWLMKCKDIVARRNI